MILIHVAYGYSQSKADLAAVDASLERHIVKYAAVVSHQLVASRIRYFPGFLIQLNFAGIFKAVIQYVAIQISVQVIVKKSRMGGVPFVVQIVFPGFLGEREISIVNEQFILFIGSFHIPGIANINIQQPVAVNICHSHAGTPWFRSFYSCLLGNVFKNEIPFV